MSVKRGVIGRFLYIIFAFIVLVFIVLVIALPPDDPAPILISVDSSNGPFSDLNCSYVITDPDGDKMNVTINWYRNDTLNLTVDFNNSYASGTAFNATLGYHNLTFNDTWKCEMRLYDGSTDPWSNWVNSSEINIINNCTYPWTNEKLIYDGCYSVRSFPTITPGADPVNGTFDKPYPEGNRCDPGTGRDERNKDFWIYVPEGSHKVYELFVVIHGSFGSANFAMNNFAFETMKGDGEKFYTPYNKEFFDDKGIIVLAPHFKFYSPNGSSVVTCNGTDKFDQFFKDFGGAIHINEGGDVVGASHRSDKWLLFLIDYVEEELAKQNYNLTTNNFSMYGFSRGGQFISSFSQAYSEKIDRAATGGANQFWVGASIHVNKTDLRDIYGTNLDFENMAVTKNVSLNAGIGTVDTLGRICTNKRYICTHVKEYCDFDESPYFDCDIDVYAPGSECEGQEPTSPGTESCNIDFAWVQGAGHNGVRNYPTAASFIFSDLPLPYNPKLYMINSSGDNLALFDTNGELVLRNDCISSSNCVASPDSLIWKDSTGDTVAYINSTGHLCIENSDCLTIGSSATCNPTINSFIVRNSSGHNMSYIDFNGNLCLTGKLYVNESNLNLH